METYQLIELPKFSSYFTATKDEAVAYFDWLIHEIPVRIRLLEKAVNSENIGADKWVADFSRNSLSELGEWYYNQVDIQTPSSEFIAAYEKRNQFAGVLSSRLSCIPSSVTLSLAVDIGLYFGGILIRNSNRLQWAFLDDKNDIDHNQAVVTGFQSNEGFSFHCNPVGLIHTLALQFIDRREPPTRLLDIYDFWHQLVSNNDK